MLEADLAEVRIDLREAYRDYKVEGTILQPRKQHRDYPSSSLPQIMFPLPAIFYHTRILKKESFLRELLN